jgi:hypothetical protein
MGLHKGCKGNNPKGNPNWEEVRWRRGSKPGIKRGPYKTNKLFQHRDAPMKPHLKIVDGVEEYVGAKAFLQTMVCTSTLSWRDRKDAAGILIAYEEVKPEGHFLSIAWDKKAPADLEEAKNQLGEIVVLLRQQKIKDTDAKMLTEGILSLFEPMDRLELINRLSALETHVGDGKQFEENNASSAVITGGLPSLPGCDIAMPGSKECSTDGVVTDDQKSGRGVGETDQDSQAADKDPGRA